MMDVACQISSKILPMLDSHEINKSEIKQYDDKHEAPICLEMRVLSPESGNVGSELLKIFDTMNEVKHSMLNREDFELGASDMVYTIIPADKVYRTFPDKNFPYFEQNMSTGIVKSKRNNALMKS